MSKAVDNYLKNLINTPSSSQYTAPQPSQPIRVQPSVSAPVKDDRTFFQKVKSGIKQSFGLEPGAYAPIPNPLNIATSAAEPALKGIASATRSVQATPALFTGDYARANEIMARPLFGQKTALGSTNLENVGTALNAASNLIGARGASTVVEQAGSRSFGQAVKTGVGQGAKAGALGGLGSYLENTENPTYTGAGLATLQGGAGGALGGAIAPGFVDPRGYGRFLKGAIKNPLTPDTQVAFTRAIKPGKNNTKFSGDAELALPHVKETEKITGKPIKDLGSLDDAITVTKKRIWATYESQLNPNETATIDGNKIADAMVSSLDRRFVLQNPAKAKRIVETADTYRRPITLEQAEDFLQSANNDLYAYYAKNKVNQQVAAKDPTTGYIVNEAKALRESLYERLGELSGQDAAQVKRVYGALDNIQREVIGRKNVLDRQAPVSLGQQISRISGAGDILKGIIDIPSKGSEALKGVVSGTGKVLLGNKMRQLNDSNYLVEQVFQTIKPQSTVTKPYTGQRQALLEAPKSNYPKASNNVPIRLPAKIKPLETQSVKNNNTVVEGGKVKTRTGIKVKVIGALKDRINEAKANSGDEGGFMRFKNPTRQQAQSEWNKLQKRKIKLLEGGASESSPTVKNIIRSMRLLEEQMR